MIYNNCDIKWLWFDLDDTLIDFTTNSRMALVKTFHYAKLNRWFSDEYCWIRCYEKHNHALWDAAARGEITSTFLKAERFRRRGILQRSARLRRGAPRRRLPFGGGQR